jgi:hypothetical protein
MFKQYQFNELEWHIRWHHASSIQSPSTRAAIKVSTLMQINERAKSKEYFEIRRFQAMEGLQVQSAGVCQQESLILSRELDGHMMEG